MFEIMLPKSLLEDYVDIEAAGSCWSPNIHLLGGGGYCTFTKPQPPAWESSFYPSWQNGESTEALGSWHYEIFRSFQVILFEERNSLLFYVSQQQSSPKFLKVSCAFLGLRILFLKWTGQGFPQ